MSEVRLNNPLHALHAQTAAEFQSYAELEIVSTFGQPEAEYSAIRKAAALMDLPQRGVLELTGKDRLAFLNNLLTNQTWDKQAKSGIAAGSGVYAYFLNLKGRIVADMNVLELGERTLLETDARMVEVLRQAFEKFVFSEQVQIVSKLGALHRIALHGPEALSVLNDAAGTPLPELAPLGSVQTSLLGIDATLFRDDECSTHGYHVIVAADRAAELWQGLLTQFSNPLELGKRRLRPIGWAAYNACRIEGGRPLFDIDFGNSADPNQSVLPAEAGQFDRAVSVTKGCYLGQEIVARMHARQQVAKQLVGLRMAEDALPIAGATLFDEKQNQIGMITSSTISPILSGACIALGYLKKPFFALGTEVIVPAEGSMRKAVVTALPFVQPAKTSEIP
ncbi:MAG: putative Aminomethyltransferase, glycine cleavage system protein [Phycisphaerales bacterium]|nr:putative Aminomethyltransferase, glycine cleavage system protein [Phycisphaerales bacterium]